MGNDVWPKLDMVRLGEVAKRALADQQFRTDASDPTKTQDTIENDQVLAQVLTTRGVGPLDDEELAFCIGWAQLANRQFKTDDELIKAIQKELSDGPPAG